MDVDLRLVVPMLVVLVLVFLLTGPGLWSDHWGWGWLRDRRGRDRDGKDR